MMEKRYDHTQEQDIYTLWEQSGYFTPENCITDGITKADADTFSIVLPPPNVTGNLHMGHAAMLVLEDMMVRYNRMRGKRTLWIPGTDHAAIATQAKVEKALYKKDKTTRHDLGREKFLERVDEFAKESHDNIVTQIKSMGASVDWTREAFTLDEKRSLSVRTAFKRMYDDGLIFKGARIVNWDPNLQTTVSDDEVDWIEEKTPFYYLQYGPFQIATARPETKFGDKYVVMHPDDPRYKDYTHRQTIDLEWINGPITATIIKDEAIDPEFGTGVMTITPWHDATDFDIAERHNLEKEQIIDFNGTLLPIAGEFAGMHIKKARPQIVERLKDKGLLVKVDENYTHRIATNSRGGGIIEPQIKEQWFVDVHKTIHMPHSNITGIKEGDDVTLKDLMRQVVENGQVTIIPERFRKIYNHWINNLRNWCISRQLWYGHRIPVWYKDGETYCDITPPEGDGWIQDPDTLDTWFSSGLWTFSTLGWPDKTDDLKTYHPTSVLETGYDIIFFWVARMILMTTYLLGDIPFKTVYLHGLVRDEKGQKMSKSLGNGIDPLEMIEKYGADATRLSLVVGTGPGNDLRLSEDKVKAYRNFGTKIWNVARFLDMNTPESYDPEIGKTHLTKEDMQALEDLRAVHNKVTDHYEKFEFHLAGEEAYDYFWKVFANHVLEAAKPRLRGDDNTTKQAAFYLIRTIFERSLIMLHPFMPFITETLYQRSHPDTPLMVAAWDWE